MSWHDANAGSNDDEGEIHLTRDMDGLFRPGGMRRDLVVATGEPLRRTEFQPPAQPNRGVSAGPVIDVDRSNGPHQGRIYITYVHRVSGDDADVRLAYSDDSGTNWERITIDRSTGTEFLPWVDFNQKSGAVSLLYY